MMKKTNKLWVIGTTGALLALGFGLGIGLTACKDKDDDSVDEICTHVYTNACDMICDECEETRSITHAWVDADCYIPKTCSVCATTEGAALGHSYTVVSYDDHYHFNTCAACGEMDETSMVKHTLDDEYTCECGCTYEIKRGNSGRLVELYNANGDVVKDFYYYDGVLESYSDYYYNEDGNELKEEYFDADGTMLGYSSYEYDENGNKIKYLWDYGKDNQGYSLYYYNENNKRIKYESFDFDNVMLWFTLYEYDSKGNKVKSEEYDENGTLTWYKLYEHNEKGQETKYSMYDGNGEWEYTYLFPYHFKAITLKQGFHAYIAILVIFE